MMLEIMKGPGGVSSLTMFIFTAGRYPVSSLRLCVRVFAI